MSPESQFTPASSVSPAPTGLARLLIASVRGYQTVLSPALHALAGPGGGCRFSPSCSHYAIEALALHGPIHGTTLTARRLLRCHPWGPSGIDLVPPKTTRAA